MTEGQEILEANEGDIPDDSKTKEDIHGNNTNARISSVDEKSRGNELVTKWSEFLRSPSDLPSFSPSLDIDEGKHGSGLLLATERSKAVSRFGRRTATYFLEVSQAYETFGQVLLKVSQNLFSLTLSLPDSTKEDAKRLRETILSFAKETRQIAEYYKTTVVAPIQTSLTANRNLLETHGQRYVASRSQSQQARRRALSARIKYATSVRNAERMLKKWKAACARAAQNSNSEEVQQAMQCDTNFVWEKVLREYGEKIPEETNALIGKLLAMEEARQRYEELVESENHAVQFAQKMEGVTLDEIQNIEKDRIRFFEKAVVQTIRSIDQNKLRQIPVSIPEHLESRSTSIEDLGGPDSKRGNMFSSIFVKQNDEYEEGQGVIDAETLNLPKELGELRDRVKLALGVVDSYIKATQILGNLLQDYRTGAARLCTGLKIDSQLDANDSLGYSASAVIGSRVGSVWKDLISIYESEGDTVGEFSVRLADVIQQQFVAFLETAPKDIRYETETDDSNWKTLCDATRSENKAAARYRQTKVNEEKLRERAQSADSGKESKSGSPQKNRMSKALFAGGEAMKKFQENARIAMAKNSLSDAELSSAKEQQALDVATHAKEQAIANYKRVTQARIQKLEAIVTERSVASRAAMQVIADGTEKLRGTRNEAIKKPKDSEWMSSEALLRDVEEWAIAANRDVKAIQNGIQGSELDPVHTGFKLQKIPIVIESLQKLFTIATMTDVPEVLVLVDTDALSVETSDGDLEANSFEDSVDTNTSVQSLDDPTGESTLSQRDAQNESKKAGSEISTDAILPKGLAALRSGTGIVGRAWDSFESDTEIPTWEDLVRRFPGEAGRESEVLKSFRCTYRPKERNAFLIPSQPGKLATTAEKMFFLGAGGKGFVLPWEKIVDIRKEKGFMGISELSVTYAIESESHFSLGRLDSVDAVLEHVDELRREFQSEEPGTNFQSDSHGVIGDVPPDDTLKKMTVVLSKRLPNVTIKQVYEKVWSEGLQTNERPFYEPWLVTEECFDISVPDWEVVQSGSKGFQNGWCAEHYTHRRQVAFKFKRTSHLYMGNPIADVKQVHYCRVEGSDKCIVAIAASFDGLPYSDTFGVEMRWVARRVGKCDLQVEVGLEVTFKKTTMLKSQIRTGTIAETKNLHLRLFEAIKKACSVSGEIVISNDTLEVVDDAHTRSRGFLEAIRSALGYLPMDMQFLTFAAAIVAYPMLWGFFSSLFGAPGISMNEARRLNVRIDELRDEVQQLRQSLDLAIKLLQDKSTGS